MTVGSFSQTAYCEEYLVWDSRKDVQTTVPFGFSAYFDATYGVAAVGFRANGNTHTKTTQVILGTTIISDADDENSAGFLSLSLLGKYPFALGPVSLFPLFGIKYDLKAPLTDQEKADLNQFWFKAGVGADIRILKGLYVRPQVLLGFKLLSQAEREQIETRLGDGATVARKTDFVFEGGVQAGWRF
ncbi:MAG: hypothetical protein NTU62_07870 [Spirochaetes bacterium]|nr:hypothetical protein [Spirochaetota bacterium]